jgi:hypothetical protein
MEEQVKTFGRGEIGGGPAAAVVRGRPLAGPTAASPRRPTHAAVLLTGVTWAWPARRAAAARMSSTVAA